jgi:hypothetical protein
LAKRLSLFKFKRHAGHFKLLYLVKVRNIAKVTRIDLHLGKKGQNGPRIYNLFGPTNPGISTNKGVVFGKIIPSKFEGPLRGHSLFKLIKLFFLRKVYVNVHTSQHPNGEIRGQVKPVHKQQHHHKPIS